METIGLIAAMTQESSALFSYIREWERIALGTLRGKRFELSRQTYNLVTSGMGVRRASEAARELIKRSAPRLLISFGVAGAVEADLEIGDVVVIEAVCRLEKGVPSPLVPLNHWSDKARKVAAQVLAGRGVRLFSGTAVTTGGSQVLEYRLKEMVHPVLEMETAGIAQVAAEKGIPFLSMRAINDGPCAPIPFDLDKIMDEDANLQAGRILMAMVHHPRIALQIRRLTRNTRIAADNVAIALIAALSNLAI